MADNNKDEKDNKPKDPKEERLRAVAALNTFLNVEGLPTFDKLRGLMMKMESDNIRTSEHFLENYRGLLQPLIINFAKEFGLNRPELTLVLCLMYQGCIMSVLADGKSPEQIMDLISGWLLEKIAGTNVRN